jgi:hypothetical protein
VLEGVEGPNNEVDDGDNNTAVTSYPSILDAEYVCDTTDCEEHWQCQRIRWSTNYRGRPLPHVLCG